MRILIVNSIYGYVGGIETYIHKTGIHLKNSDWTLYGLFETKAEYIGDFGSIFSETFFFSDYDIKEDLYHKIALLKIDAVIIHRVNNLELLKKLNECFKTIVVVHDHDYYCLRRHKYFPIKRINCHLPMNNLVCSLCSLMIKKNSNSKFGFSLINKKNIFAVKKELMKSYATIVLSDFMKKNLIMNGWEKEKIHKLYPIHEINDNIAYDKIINSKSNELNLLYVGQLIRGKGVDILINACRLLKINYHLKIVGRGNDYEYLKNLIDIYGLNKKIELVGWVDNIDHFYNEADIVVVPSRWQEPFGLIGIEAFSRKRPVIGFNIGGIPEWLIHNYNGFLVNNQNPKYLASAITFAFNNPDIIQQWGKNGYDYVKKNYSSDIYISTLNNIIRSKK